MKNLTVNQRDKLEALVRLNNSYTTKGRVKQVTQKEMSKVIGCSQPTISRELSRNSSVKTCVYSTPMAQMRAEKRRKNSKDLYPVWADNENLFNHVMDELIDGKTPEQIRGRRLFKNNECVSVPTIYAYIKKDKKNGGSLYKALRYQYKKHKWRGFGASRERIPGRIDIDDRPEVVDLKERFGDWESDLVVSPMSGSGALATFAERVSMYCRAIVIPTKEASNMVNATVEALSEYPQDMKASMTHDNGPEIVRHEEITERLGMPVYCAHPYSSWERGLNEWTNRELRRFFPKGTDFSKVKQKAVDFAVNWLNNCPRKTLGYRTPNEVFEEGLKIMHFKV